jgi:hypothetical protein
MEIADPAEVHKGCGEKPAEADVEEEAAFHHLDDGALDSATLSHHFLDAPPGSFVLRALLGEDEAAFLVFFLENERLDLVPYLHHFAGVDVMADRELLRGDDAFGFVSDVEKNLIVVDADDLPADEVAVVEILE